jgi:hypothetical protein
MRNGNVVKENDLDKVTLLADHLATQCGSSAYLVAELNLVADAEE